jgi:kynurenine formamidase
MASFAGLHASCLPWLKQRDIAILGSDSASDVIPSQIEGVAMPVHQVIIVAMGTWILDVLDLERAGRECQQRQRWEFLLTVGPLRIVGGTGSPINPIATF